MVVELVKLMVAEVKVAVPAGPGVGAGELVLIEVDEPRRQLRIVIAQAEARAIQAAWTGVIPSRPSTWDLYVSTVALLEARLDRAVITDVKEDRYFFANLELERHGERRVLACRPSDAVAVALRAYAAEIYAEAHVLDTAGLSPDGTKAGPYRRPEPEPELELEPEPVADPWPWPEASPAAPLEPAPDPPAAPPEPSPPVAPGSTEPPSPTQTS